MNGFATFTRRAFIPMIVGFLPLVLIVGTSVVAARPTMAQETGPQPLEPATADSDVADREAAAAAAAGLPPVEDETASSEAGEENIADAEQSEQPAAPAIEKKINILKLLVAGGHLMWPIVIMSMLVVTFGVERMLGLRRCKVLPPQLISGLGSLTGQKGGFDPRQAYKLCQQYHSAAANVIKTMLLKVGRPHTEVERAVSEANDREAARLYANVRWLGLAAGVSPLLGLLGTVWGMIQAFFATANLPTGANKAEHLANGIYVALVTTFAGLAVAIPAAVLAHFFEGWIQKLFRELDETLLGLMPQLERFEGRLRVSRDQIDGSGTGDERRAKRGAAPDGEEKQRPLATPK